MNFVRALVVLASVGIVGASLAMTFSYSITTATGYAQAVVVCIALSAALLKIMIAILIHDRPFRTCVLACALWFGCFLYDSTMISGFTSFTRDAFTGDLAEKAKARIAVEISEGEKGAELAKLPSTRAPETIRQALDTATRNAGICTPARAYLDACVALDNARAEQAAVDARRRVEAELLMLRNQLKGMPEVIVYPEAHSLAVWLRSIGATVSDERIAGFLRILIVLLVDFGPIIAVRLALEPVPMGFEDEEVQTPRLRVAPSSTRPKSIKNGTPSAAVLLALKDALSGKVIPGVRLRGSDLHFAMRDLATHLKVSPGTLKRSLETLAVQNRVAYRTNNTGTVVYTVN